MKRGHPRWVWTALVCAGLNACGSGDSPGGGQLAVLTLAPLTGATIDAALKRPVEEGLPVSNGGHAFSVADGLSPFSPMRRLLAPVANRSEAASVQDAKARRDSPLGRMAYVGYLAAGPRRVALLQIDHHVMTAEVGALLSSERARVRHVGDAALVLDVPIDREGSASVALSLPLTHQGRQHEQ